MFTHVVRPHHYRVSCGPGNEIIEKVRPCVGRVMVGSIGWDIEEYELSRWYIGTVGCRIYSVSGF